LLVAMQYKQLRSFVSEKPMPLDSIPESAQAQAEARARIEGFLTGKKPDSLASDTLAVSAPELNHLARSSKILSDLGLDYHLDFQDTLLVARNSLPVDRLQGFMSVMARLMRVKGFLNSEMKGYPEFKDGVLLLIPVSAVMNGQVAPVSVLNSKGKLDVREWVSDKDAYDRAIAMAADVEIRGGRLLIIKKP
jgi:hypothetical protein